ncbi:hypothetical protein CAEBREN_07520 [Caenorhabditis brenneri]|uniref:Uncharacterized protein n=1 Tax=Caenorhabditis brenneri TaxID=135651 RepID=G0N5L9_CAEBE|nr:hypothetical protein CAEBREN_07520 [Caenorhabditis brenneri]
MANRIVFIVLIISDCFLIANGYYPSDFNSPFVFEEKVYINHDNKNFVSSTTIRDEVTGSLTTEYRGCENDDYSDEVYKTLIKYDRYIKLNSFLNYHPDDKEITKCVETEPGHVALIAADRKETDCVYAGVSHPYTTSWSDKSKAARFSCSEGNIVFKSYCEIEDEWININSEHKLSNGCTFICDSKKNIYKCDNQLPNMQVMKSK